MTNAQLADLLEEAARRLRGGDSPIGDPAPIPAEVQEPDVVAYSKSLTTAQLSEATGVPVKTIRRLAVSLGGIPVGGRHGFEFPQKAIGQLPLLIRESARNRKTPGTAKAPGVRGR